MNYEVTKLDNRHSWHLQFKYMIEFKKSRTYFGSGLTNNGVLEFDRSRRWFNEKFGWSQDVETRASIIKSAPLDELPEAFNPSLAAAKGWFEYHYDQEYQNDIYLLLRESILENITKPYISLNNLEVSLPFVIEPNSIDFSKLWRTERGVVNHYTTAGNKTVFSTIDLAITKVL